jgi:hypothetical protein
LNPVGVRRFHAGVGPSECMPMPPPRPRHESSSPRVRSDTLHPGNGPVMGTDGGHAPAANDGGCDAIFSLDTGHGVRGKGCKGQRADGVGQRADGVGGARPRNPDNVQLENWSVANALYPPPAKGVVVWDGICSVFSEGRTVQSRWQIWQGLSWDETTNTIICGFAKFLRTTCGFFHFISLFFTKINNSVHFSKQTN